MGDRFRLIGTVIDGKYRVEKVVGEGGFGIVYRAQHLVFRKPVAIKCLVGLEKAKPADRDKLIEQFVSEGALLAELSSQTPNIVQARDIGSLTAPTGDWFPYLVLEWLDGKTLADWLCDPDGRPCAPLRSADESVALMHGAAQALALAHKHGVAHRDLKPANLMVVGKTLTPGVMVKILDFGIAKIMHSLTTSAMRATQGAPTAFTPQYGAPEQWDRKEFGATGPWTDVYQTALILIEIMRGGSPALNGESWQQLMFATIHSENRPTPRYHGLTVSDDVERVFRKALAVQVEDRYPNMSQFWQELDSAHARQKAVTPQLQSHPEPQPAPPAPAPAPPREPPAPVLTPPREPPASTPAPPREPPAPTPASPREAPTPAPAPPREAPSPASAPPREAPAPAPALSREPPAPQQPDRQVTQPGRATGRGAALAVGGALVVAGVGLGFYAFTRPDAPPAERPHIPSAKSAAPVDWESVLSAKRNLGRDEVRRTRHHLERTLDAPGQAPAAIAAVKLAQAELILLNVVSQQMATMLDPNDSELTSSIARDLVDAGSLIEESRDSADPAQQARAEALLALAQGKLDSPALAGATSDFGLLVRGAPLWLDGGAAVPSGLITALQSATERTTLQESLLALALWRSGDVKAASRAVDGILARVPDMVAAHALHTALQGAAKTRSIEQIPQLLPKPDPPAVDSAPDRLSAGKIRSRIKPIWLNCAHELVDFEVTFTVRVDPSGKATVSLEDPAKRAYEAVTCFIQAVERLQFAPTRLGGQAPYPVHSD